jgi:hypothetical protein
MKNPDVSEYALFPPGTKREPMATLQDPEMAAFCEGMGEQKCIARATVLFVKNKVNEA